ncbi:MAG: 16S rRNA (cytosine(1402)-N(4))-methyltransferase, partial [Synergistaceae bacterium]|nr:16S rRNA (cytosine(1402)-N(4))-methyltransferase [Synergistaceae bacterium]
LVNLIRDTLPAPVQRKMGTHPARRIFQALRIYVNNETEELEKLLKALKICAKKNSLIIFVSYHSLEDRLVKKNFREWQNENLGKILTKHPLIPSDEEIKSNYKSRSGKLRAFCINSD